MVKTFEGKWEARSHGEVLPWIITTTLPAYTMLTFSSLIRLPKTTELRTVDEDEDEDEDT